MKWTTKEDQTILIFILDHCKIQVPYQELSLHLGCTPKALSHRIANLRKVVKSLRQTSTVDGSGNEDPAPVTPKKRTRTTVTKTKATKPNKKVKVETSDDDEGEVWTDAEEGYEQDGAEMDSFSMP